MVLHSPKMIIFCFDEATLQAICLSLRQSAGQSVRIFDFFQLFGILGVTVVHTNLFIILGLPYPYHTPTPSRGPLPYPYHLSLPPFL